MGSHSVTCHPAEVTFQQVSHAYRIVTILMTLSDAHKAGFSKCDFSDSFAAVDKISTAVEHQCFDAVGWASGRAEGMVEVGTG